MYSRVSSGSRAWRVGLGLSQMDVALLACMTRSRIAYLESGRGRMTEQERERLGAALHLIAQAAASLRAQRKRVADMRMAARQSQPDGSIVEHWTDHDLVFPNANGTRLTAPTACTSSKCYWPARACPAAPASTTCATAAPRTCWPLVSISVWSWTSWAGPR